MAASISAAAATADRELVISRVFDAPRRLVFKAWTQPEMLVRWGPREALDRLATYLPHSA